MSFDQPGAGGAGFDAQWADLSFLDDNLLEPVLDQFLQIVLANFAAPEPPYGSPERAVHDWQEENQ